MPNNKIHYSTHHPKSQPPTRISHIDFSDLIPTTYSIGPDQALTKAQIIIYRSRDKAVGITQDEKLLLNLISEEIEKLARKLK